MKTAKEQVRDHLLFYKAEFDRIGFTVDEKVLKDTLHRLEVEL